MVLKTSLKSVRVVDRRLLSILDEGRRLERHGERYFYRRRSPEIEWKAEIHS